MAVPAMGSTSGRRLTPAAPVIPTERSERRDFVVYGDERTSGPLYKFLHPEPWFTNHCGTALPLELNLISNQILASGCNMWLLLNPGLQTHRKLVFSPRGY